MLIITSCFLSSVLLTSWCSRFFQIRYVVRFLHTHLLDISSSVVFCRWRLTVTWSSSLPWLQNRNTNHFRISQPSVVCPGVDGWCLTQLKQEEEQQRPSSSPSSSSSWGRESEQSSSSERGGVSQSEGDSPSQSLFILTECVKVTLFSPSSSPSSSSRSSAAAAGLPVVWRSRGEWWRLSVLFQYLLFLFISLTSTCHIIAPGNKWDDVIITSACTLKPAAASPVHQLFV